MDYGGFLKSSLPLMFPSKMREIAEASPIKRQAMAAEGATGLVNPLYVGFLRPAIPATGKIGSITRSQLGKLLRKGSAKALDYIQESLRGGADPMQIQDAVRNELLSAIAETPKGVSRQTLVEKIKVFEPVINDMFRRYSFQ